MSQQPAPVRQPGVFVLSGPAGSGKTAVLAGLRHLEPDVYYCVTATTRQPRPGERHGVDYFFYSVEAFEEGIARGEFLEHARVPPNGGRLYGTPRRQVEDALEQGRDVFLQIDVQGARSIRQQIPSATTIFLKPPDMESLRHRLVSRGTESAEEVERRLANAQIEMSCEGEFDCSVVNANGALAEAIAAVRTIISRRRQESIQDDQPNVRAHG